MQVVSEIRTACYNACRSAGHRQGLRCDRRGFRMSTGGKQIMSHIRTISCRRPTPGQYESLLQLVGLLNAVLALFVNLCEVFGIPISSKEPAS